MAHTKTEIKKAKNLLNKFAPKGEQLAYINSKEARLLKSKGGAGKMTKAGIRSYTEDEEDTGDVSNSGSSSSSNGGGGGNDNGGGNNQPASYRSVAAKTAAPKSILSRIGGFLTTAALTLATGGLFGVGKIASSAMVQGAKFASRKGFTNKSKTGYNSQLSLAPSGVNIVRDNNGGGNDTPPAQNVGGRIVKLSPTTAEVSQSSATDASPYDNRKTKARGRSMTIRTNSRGMGRNMGSVLGTKSLLGAA